MIDGIIKADGTSRLMRAELPATYEEFRAQCRAGTQPLDVLFNAIGWSQLPTFLNKANLLKDPTAVLFGLGADAVPNTIFDWLGQYNTYWWSVLHGQASKGYEEKRTTIADSITVYKYDETAGRSIYYSKEITINQTDGTVALSAPVEIALAKGMSDEEVQEVLATLCGMAPLYLTNAYENETAIYYIPEGATQGSYSSSCTFIRGRTPSTSFTLNHEATDPVASSVTTRVYNIPAGETTYVHSADRNAYPDSGTVDGLTYEYLGIPFQNAVTAPKIATGSYVGTGTYGESNPNSLTFDFVPKLLLITGVGGSGNNGTARCFAHAIVGDTNIRDAGGTCKIAEWGKTISWWGTYNSSSYPTYGQYVQLNGEGYVYRYFAIG